MRRLKVGFLRTLSLILCFTFIFQGVVVGAGVTSGIRIDQSDLYLTSMPTSDVSLTVSTIDSSESITGNINWSTNSNNIATVDSSGSVKFTGLNGSVMITAEYEGHSASITATLNAPRTLLSMNYVKELTYSGPPVQLSVIGNYSDSTSSTISSGLTWSSSNPNVATVSNTGLVDFTGKNGSVSITARIGSIEVTSSPVIVNNPASKLIIEAPGGVFAYSPAPVVLKAIDGSTVLTNAVWRSSDSTIATVSNGTVTFSGKKGSVTIYASYGDKTASATTTVNTTVASIAIKGMVTYSPTPIQLKGEATYSDNSKQNFTDAVWTSSNTSIATITNSGLVTFTGKNGPLKITVTYGGKSDSITVDVFDGTVLKSLRINETLNYSSAAVNLSLTGTLASNLTQSIPASSATWKSSDTSIANVNSSGAVTYTGRNGPVTITATYKGIAASQYAYIDSSTAVKDLKINEALYYSSSSVELTLTATLNNSQTQNIQSSKASWKSSDTTIATVTTSGYVKYTGKNGNVTITATYANKSATVSAYIDSSIDIYDLRINESLYYSKSSVPLTLTATDKYGYEVTIPSSKANWKSSDTSIASVSSSGYVSYTGKYGYVQITATYGNRSASQTEYITTDNNINALEINEKLYYSPFTVPLTLTATLTNGTTQSIPSSNAVWSSSDTSIATVSNGGVVTYKGKSGPLTIKATYGSRVASQYANIDTSNTLVGLEIDGDLFYSSSAITLQLTGTLRDGNTQVIPSSSVTWKSSDTNIATVSNGVVSYKGRSGPLTITASYGSLVATKYADIDSTVYLKQLVINETLSYSSTPISLTLNGVFSNNATQRISSSSAVWKSSDTSIATVSNSGVITYKGKNGSVTITATYAGKVASVNANISTSATLSMLMINETLYYSVSPITLTLTGTLLNGTTQKINASSAVWSSSNSAIATVSNGVVTFKGKEGYVSISASYGGRAANVSTTVNGATNPNPNSTNNPFIVSVNNKDVENKILNKIRTIKPLYSLPNYPDSSNHWASREIKLAKELELVSGYPDGTFQPNKNVTRAEFVIMINRTFSIPVGSGSYSQFKDISDSYAKQSIMAMYNLGLINGYQDGTFKPNNQITRAEVVAILSNLINFNNVTQTGNASFTDTNKHWAASKISQIANAGIISGKSDGIFAPNDNTTRAEAISLLLRTLSLNSNIKNALATL